MQHPKKIIRQAKMPRCQSLWSISGGCYKLVRKFSNRPSWVVLLFSIAAFGKMQSFLLLLLDATCLWIVRTSMFWRENSIVFQRQNSLSLILQYTLVGFTCHSHRKCFGERIEWSFKEGICCPSFCNIFWLASHVEGYVNFSKVP